jgi:hypothetical protein
VEDTVPSAEHDCWLAPVTVNCTALPPDAADVAAPVEGAAELGAAEVGAAELGAAELGAAEDSVTPLAFPDELPIPIGVLP